MILLKFTPESTKVVDGQKSYAVQWSQDHKVWRPLDFRVKAKNMATAELMVLFCFTRELKGKTLDFDIENVKTKKEEKQEENREQK